MREITTSALKRLLVMTRLAFAFAFVLSFAFIGEARAACVIDTHLSLSGNCLSGIDAQKNNKGEYICGNNCTFTIEGTKIKVKATGANATIKEGMFCPSCYSSGKIVDTKGNEVNFSEIELDGNFSFGTAAFYGSGKTVSTTNGRLNLSNAALKGLGLYTTVNADVYVTFNDSLWAAQTLQSTVVNGNLIFAEGVTDIGNWFMGNAQINGDVVIPASVKSIAADNFITVGEGYKVYCGAGNCYDLFLASCNKDKREPHYDRCINKLNDLLHNGQLDSYSKNCTDYKCSSCKNGLYKKENDCITEANCKDGYTIDKENKMCNKIAGCASFVDGACTCDEGYYTKAGGCVSADEGCGKYYYKKQNGCVSFEEGCGEGWLEKNRECIEASEGCGDGYKDLGGWCNRVIYTPAEAAPLLTDENNMVTITFRK